MSTAEAPPALRRFQLTRRIGAGGGVTLWTAYERSTGREVDIELVDPVIAGRAGFPARLVAVARQVAPLQHPNVLATYDVVAPTVTQGSPLSGAPDIALAVVTQAADGLLLRDLAPLGTRLPLATAMAVVDDVLRGIEAAHAARLVHCGLTPDRVVVLPAGYARLGGFAMARALALTAGPGAAPEPGYSSPERLKGAMPDGLGDLYAAGALACALLSGAPPRPGVPPQLSQLPVAVPALTQAIAVDPQNRPGSAQELRMALAVAAIDAMGPDWRRRSDLGQRVQDELARRGRVTAGWTPPGDPHASATLIGRAAQPPRGGPSSGAASTSAESAVHAQTEVRGYAAAAPGRAATRTQPERRAAPSRRRRRLGAAFAAIALLAAGAAVAVALIVAGNGGGSSAVPAHVAFAVGNDLRLDVSRVDSGACDVVFHFTARGSLAGSGTLSYRFDQSDGHSTPVISQPVTNETSFALDQDWRFQGARTGSATMTFVIISPTPREVSKEIDTTCP